MTKDLVAQAMQEVAREESKWKSFAMQPPKVGYYWVRDCNDRDGVAFMNRNRTWTPIDNVKKPYSAWREIQ